MLHLCTHIACKIAQNSGTPGVYGVGLSEPSHNNMREDMKEDKRKTHAAAHPTYMRLFIQILSMKHEKHNLTLDGKCVTKQDELNLWEHYNACIAHL